jgi:hypothetical protein
MVINLAAAGGDSGVIVAIQIEQLGRIVVPVANYRVLEQNCLLEKNNDAGVLPSHPPNPLASDHWKLLSLTENPLLPWPAFINIGFQAG